MVTFASRLALDPFVELRPASADAPDIRKGAPDVRTRARRWLIRPPSAHVIQCGAWDDDQRINHSAFAPVLRRVVDSWRRRAATAAAADANAVAASASSFGAAGAAAAPPRGESRGEYVSAVASRAGTSRRETYPALVYASLPLPYMLHRADVSAVRHTAACGVGELWERREIAPELVRRAPPADTSSPDRPAPAGLEAAPLPPFDILDRATVGLRMGRDLAHVCSCTRVRTRERSLRSMRYHAPHLQNIWDGAQLLLLLRHRWAHQGAPWAAPPPALHELQLAGRGVADCCCVAPRSRPPVRGSTAFWASFCRVAEGACTNCDE